MAFAPAVWDPLVPLEKLGDAMCDAMPWATHNIHAQTLRCDACALDRPLAASEVRTGHDTSDFQSKSRYIDAHGGRWAVW